MDRNTCFLSGFVLGAVAGAAAAVLMAPRPGTELQAQIRRRLAEIAEEGRRAAAARRAELEAQFAQARQFQKPSVTSVA